MRKALRVSLGLFVIGCCLPALEFRRGSTAEISWGVSALGFGWLGVFAGVLGWIANPFWLGGMLFGWFGKRIPLIILAVLAIIFGVSTLGVIGQDLPADEGGVGTMTLQRLLPGCYAWLLSLWVLLIASFFPRPVAAPPPVQRRF